MRLHSSQQHHKTTLKLHKTGFIIPVAAFLGLGAIGTAMLVQDTSDDASALNEPISTTLSHGAYYLSLDTSSSSIELDVEAMANGTYVYASDTLTAKTNADTYRLYISSNDENTAALTRTGGSETIGATTGTGGNSGTPAALAINKYGYAVPTDEINNAGFSAKTLYDSAVAGTITDDTAAMWAGVPVKGASTMDLIHSGTKTGNSQASDTGEDTHVYYAVRANNGMTAGTYTGQILYTMVADIETQDMSVSPATATANETQTVTVVSGPIIAAGTSLTTSQVTITIGGSACTIASNSAIVTTSGHLVTTCTAPALTGSDEGTAYDLRVQVPDYGYDDTLAAAYVVTAPAISTLDDIEYMQDVNTYSTVEFCKNSTLYSDGSKQYTLKDKRDNSEYTIRKLADGKCWMVNNLKLSADTLNANTSRATPRTTLTSEDTDLTGTATFTVPATSNANWGGSSYTIAAKIANSNNADYGMYYNWWAAVASTNNPTTNYQSVDTSICPKGWDLPKGQGAATRSTNNDWWAMLVTGYGLKDYYETSSTSGNPTNFTTGAYNLPFSGYWSYSQTSPQNQGTNGYWWSSTVFSESNAYSTYVGNNGNVGAGTSNYNKRFGYSVRCVLSV